MTPEKYAQRLIAKYPEPLTIPTKDWWHENISTVIRSAVRAAEIEALEWAKGAAERRCNGRSEMAEIIKAEIERRKKGQGRSEQ
jgi:hypothetical protein